MIWEILIILTLATVLAALLLIKRGREIASGICAAGAQKRREWYYKQKVTRS